MKSKILIGALLLWSVIAPARADYLINQGSQTLIKSGIVGGAILPFMSPVDASAQPFGTLTNPFALQFGTGVTLPAFTTPPHVICDSGCGTSSVQFGTAIGATGTPVGFKDGSGNFQALLGDVTNGQWVSIKASVAIPVTGTFFQATQPVSAVSLPLPAGAATQTTSAAILSALGTPFQAGGSIGNTSFAATQATASNLNATVVGTGTFAVQATLQASATIAIGKVDPNTLGSWGLQASTQNSATPTNGGLVLAQFNTSPTTITPGNVSPLQMDNAGNLRVTVAGAIGLAQGSTTSGQTGSLIMAAVTTAAPSYTTAQTSPLSLDLAGNLRTNATLIAGSAIVGKFGVDQTTPGSTNGVSLVPNNNAAGSIAPVPSTSAESGHVFKSSAGSTYSAAATNLTATAGFYVLIDAASVPADGAITPKACAPLPANGAVSINYGDIPGGFSTGIVGVVTSATTCLTKTTGVITAFLSGQVK